LEHPLTKYRAKQSPPMSQAALARLLGVSRSYIHRVELGTRQIGPELLLLVCRRTGLAPEIIRPDLARAMRRAKAAE
jgi:transcriptional regulator with XRE-family HTH domain